MVDMQTGPHITRNKSEATQVSGNSISHLYPSESTEDTSARNAVSTSPPTPRSDNIDRAQPPQTGDTEDESYYRAGIEWSEINAYDPSTSQGQWDNFVSMYNTEHYDSNVFNTATWDDIGWSYLCNDWNFFHATDIHEAS